MAIIFLIEALNKLFILVNKSSHGFVLKKVMKIFVQADVKGKINKSCSYSVLSVYLIFPHLNTSCFQDAISPSYRIKLIHTVNIFELLNVLLCLNGSSLVNIGWVRWILENGTLSFAAIAIDAVAFPLLV